MLFNSYGFVFAFLPVALLVYYRLPEKKNGLYPKLWLVFASLWFYASFHPAYLAVLIASLLWNRGILALMDGGKGRRAALTLGILGNLGLLFYFKYMNFFLENLNAWLHKDLALLKVLLPLGISFFTFQQISFLVDRYRGEIKEYTTLDYALYVTYFPKLSQGPIALPGELLDRFRGLNRCFSADGMMKGIALFVMGMGKKVILADTFGRAVDYGYGNLSLMHASDALLLVLFYALQLYFDFSGYCDMARGVSRMFGIELPVNFHSPYQAANIIDFWKRWHITLNRFFTRYIYIPLGGNREGRLKMYRNLLLVFFISGLWHGAGWNYIVWGLLHGALYIVTRMVLSFRQERGMRQGQSAPREQSGGREQNARQEQHVRTVNRRRPAQSLPKACLPGNLSRGIGHALSVILTFLYVSFAWVFFRAESVAQAGELLRILGKHEFVRVNRTLAGYFNLDEFWYVLKVFHADAWEYGHYLLMGAFLAGALLLVFFGKNAGELAERMKPKALAAAALSVLLLWCVLTFSNVSTFLYFNF